MNIIRLIWESLLMALQAVTMNRLRALLSLLGITIGIFAIIAVFTIVDSLESNIRESVATLGSDVLYVEKWPWAPPEGETEYPWWKYMNRPQPSLDECQYLDDHAKGAKNTAFVAYVGRRLEYENNSIDGAGVAAATSEFKDIRAFELIKGRYFSPLEINAGRNVTVIGYTLAEKLFSDQEPLGKYIEVFGGKVRVIGVVEKEGQGTFSGQILDEVAMVPLEYFRRYVDVRREYASPQIWVQADPRVGIEELTFEVTQLMRSYRRLRPSEEDNFALNQTSIINNQLDQFFSVLKIAGFFIGVFSIIVGGFGIANIMFVSVKERTNIIGIQKALGAKRYFILFEFLFESVLLSLVGGILGLLMVFIGASIISLTAEFKVFLTMNNIILGISISSGIGLVSGIFPAWQGAKMDPVVAINTTF
jgi:putative ABC transport system permease protein